MLASIPNTYGKIIGMVFIVLLMAFIFYWPILGVIRAKTLSAKYANLSIILGLTILLISVSVVSSVPTLYQSTLFLGVAGSAGVFAGITGLVLMVLSLWHRSVDQGTGRVRPLLGGFFSSASVLHGISLFIVAAFFLPDGSAPWEYRNDEYRVTITLPSEKWKHINPGDMKVRFARPMPMMHFGAYIERADRTRFDRELNLSRECLKKQDKNCRNVKHRTGTNTRGDSYYEYTSISQRSDGKGEVFFAQLIIWIRSEQVAVKILLEGQFGMSSMAGRSMESARFEKDSQSIFDSVRGESGRGHE